MFACMEYSIILLNSARKICKVNLKHWGIWETDHTTLMQFVISTYFNQWWTSGKTIHLTLLVYIRYVVHVHLWNALWHGCMEVESKPSLSVLRQWSCIHICVVGHWPTLCNIVARVEICQFSLADAQDRKYECTWMVSPITMIDRVLLKTKFLMFLCSHVSLLCKVI